MKPQITLIKQIIKSIYILSVYLIIFHWGIVCSILNASAAVDTEGLAGDVIIV
jgi:hypothetical protein